MPWCAWDHWSEALVGPQLGPGPLSGAQRGRNCAYWTKCGMLDASRAEVGARWVKLGLVGRSCAHVADMSGRNEDIVPTFQIGAHVIHQIANPFWHSKLNSWAQVHSNRPSPKLPRLSTFGADGFLNKSCNQVQTPNT